MKLKIKEILLFSSVFVAIAIGFIVGHYLLVVKYTTNETGVSCFTFDYSR